MATDATGTPTSLGIPTLNTGADAPTGNGENAMMAAIDALFLARSATLTATGDIMYASAPSVGARLAIGSTNQVLTVVGGVPAWTAAGGFTSPMTTTGDMIYSSSGSTPARLAVGGTGAVLNVAGGIPAWLALGSAGQHLVQAGGALAWKTPATFNYTAQNVNITTAATSFKMCGFGANAFFTPTISGTMEIAFSALIAVGAGDQNSVQIAYGTGAAPTAGAAASGTVIGYQSGYGSPTSGLPVSITAVVTGLTVGTAYWVDIQQKTGSGVSSQVSSLTLAGHEI